MPAFNSPPKRSRQLQFLAGRMLYGISPEQLRAFIRVNENDENTDDSNLDKQRVLVLDCRSFVAYNSGHVVDSINVHCPAILRRRCGGRLPLRTVIPNSNVRALLSNNHCYPVVLYDEHGLNGKTLSDVNSEESTVAFVAKCLRTEADLKSIYYLEGGYQSFSRLCPDLVSARGPCPVGGSSSPCPSPRPPSSPFCPVEILPHLLLGSARDAAQREQLQQLGVTAMLNVTRLCPNLFQESFQYKCIPVRDTGCENIGAYFQEAIHFIDQVKCEQGKVLVHCQAGVSRSATICIAYLMSAKRMRMEEAYEYVKSRRRIVSPNLSFMGQLLHFEEQLFGSTKRFHGANGSPSSPIPASTPVPENLTPSQRDVFDFAAAVAPSVPEPAQQLTLSPCAT